MPHDPGPTRAQAHGRGRGLLLAAAAAAAAGHATWRDIASQPQGTGMATVAETGQGGTVECGTVPNVAAAAAAAAGVQGIETEMAAHAASVHRLVVALSRAAGMIVAADLLVGPHRHHRHHHHRSSSSSSKKGAHNKRRQCKQRLTRVCLRTI